METFGNLQLLPEIQSSLKALGFTKPTEIQEKVIPILLKNPKTDLHAQAQTGTGKTLAFGIPLLQSIDPKLKAVQVLIIAPTRELVLQIYESLKEISRGTNILIEPIYGGMPIERQITNIRRGAQIIVGTPGRLNDHLRRKTLSLKPVKILVLDEADIMLDMGFKEEIDNILNHTPENRAIWLFSATVMSGIKQLIKSNMHNVVSIKASQKGVVSSQVKQYYCIVQMRKRIEATSRFIEAAPNFYGIIFCQTKILTTEVLEQLASKSFRANCLHGDMKQTLRNHVIKGFRNKDFNILIATDVAARGIDVSDLTHVINFSIPDEYENYIHRIGRTGRAGKEGIAIAFVSPSDTYKIKRLEKAANTVLQEIQIPPLSAIIDIKMGAVSDFIEQAKKPLDNLSQVNEAIKKMIHSFSEEEIRRSFAIALEDKFFKDISREDISKFKPEVSNMPKEICIEIGEETGFNQVTIRNYLYNTCKLLPQEIYKVRVLRKKTFVSVPENRLSDCLNALKTNPITPKRHKIYLVENIPFKSHNKNRRRNYKQKRYDK